MIPRRRILSCFFQSGSDLGPEDGDTVTSGLVYASPASGHGFPSGMPSLEKYADEEFSSPTLSKRTVITGLKEPGPFRPSQLKNLF